MALVAQKTQDKADIETDLNDEKADMKGKKKDLAPWSLAKSIAILKIDGMFKDIPIVTVSFHFSFFGTQRGVSCGHFF
jgi:hypothetical protein